MYKQIKFSGMLSHYLVSFFLMFSSCNFPAGASVDEDPMESNINQTRPTLDQRLVGTWIHTEFYNSPGFSYMLTRMITITSNGELMLYEPRNSASTAGTGVYSNERVLQATVPMLTKDGRIFLVDSETGEEHLFVRYIIEGNSMIFIDAADNRKLWKRS